MVTSSINRIFAGWDEPLLPWLAKFLVENYRQDKVVDLRSISLVFTGGHAVRRFSQLLAIEADKYSAIVLPPLQLTIGEFIDYQLPGIDNSASDAIRIISWIEALRSTAKDSLKILVPQTPESNDFHSWLALAEKLDSLHLEVTGAGLTFLDVAKQSIKLASFLDEDRWLVLAQIADLYRQHLAQHGLVDKYFNRLEQLKNGAEIKLSGPLYLVSVAEINQNMRDLLAKLVGEINVVIYAPQECNQGFDDFGAVIPAYWEHTVIPLQHDCITVTESPNHLVAAIYKKIKQLSTTYSLNDISIGIGDEQEIDYIKGSLSSHGVQVRTAKGRKFSESELGFFLKGVGQYLASKSIQHFAALIRHPYCYNFISSDCSKSQQHGIQELLDLYQEKHFQAIISDRLPENSALDRELLLLVDKLEIFLRELKQAAITLSNWMPCLIKFVQSVSISSQDQEQFELLADSLKEIDIKIKFKATEILQLLIYLADKLVAVPDQHKDAIELLGWLELALDDAPGLILTSIAEGLVPEVISADPFLPNSLRMHLGLVNNSTRLARDTFLLNTILKSKKELKILISQRSLDGSPRFPSRLLLACDHDALPARTKLLYQEGKRYRLEQTGDSESDSWNLSIPKAVPIKSMTVTSFKDYLMCPYRFYLKHILNLKDVSLNQYELDALAFGTLTHRVLDLFARDKRVSATDPDIIFSSLEQILFATAKGTFGDNEYPAIKVQIEQLKERLRYFSYWQSERNRSGWVIIANEHPLDPQNCYLEFSGKSIGLRGRIDRIDYNSKLDHYQIIDYKSGDNGQIISNVYKNDSWTDLQMPLYFHALRTRYRDDQMSFAYLNLSAHSRKEQLVELSIDISKFLIGIDQAKEIAANVDRGLFWPPNYKPQKDSYDWIVSDYQSDSLEDQELYEY